MTVINSRTHFPVSFLFLSIRLEDEKKKKKKYFFFFFDSLFESIVVCLCVCELTRGDPSHRLYSIPSHFHYTQNTKRPSTGSTVSYSLLSSKGNKKILKWQSTFRSKLLKQTVIDDFWASHAFSSPPPPFKYTQVPLIGSQQSADNQQLDFDDRLFRLGVGEGFTVWLFSSDGRNPIAPKWPMWLRFFFL